VIRLPALLALLVLAGCGGSGHASSRYGISVKPPHGWHVRVARGALQAATVPLPAGRRPGEPFGRRLRRDDLAVVLFEDTPDAQWSPPLDSAFYAHGRPRPFTRADFDGPELGGANPGDHGFARRNFTVAGRYFDLFVESGAPHPSAARLRELDRLERSLRIERGDFYPGIAQPPRFTPASGWRTSGSGARPVGTSQLAIGVASTVPWVNSFNSAAPEQTLIELRRTQGIAIRVTLFADNRIRPASPGTRLRLGPVGPYRTGEGPSEPGVSARSGTWRVAREYQASVEIVYGEPYPSPAQQRRARAELARLILPSWPRWS
jgi:hypothetical protein